MTEQLRVRALLIGNWEYTDPEKRLYPLRGPKQNLAVMQAALTSEKFGLCRDEDVTVRENLNRSEIGRALLALTKDSRPDESLLIYYTGHGERLSGQQLGFCGVDAVHISLEADSFNTHELKGWLTAYNRAKSTVIVLDCCYAGQFMSAADPTTTIGNSFGAGTAVLMSGGNELVPDSDHSGEPSKYTGALAKVLVDAKIPGSGRFLTVEDAYQALLRVVPKLLPEPWRDVGGRGTLPMARRHPATEAPAAVTPLRGWQDKRFSTVDVSFDCDRVVARWGPFVEECQLDRFDSTRQAAIRRISQLADAVVRIGPPAEETARGDAEYAVRRAWECVGVNLFETALPTALQDHIKAHLDGADDQVVRLRLRFGPDGQALAQYPWEYLQLPPPATAEPGRRTIAVPLALRPRLIVERCLPYKSHAWDSRSVEQSTPNVGIVNALPFPYSGAGRRLAVELKNLATVRFISDLADDKAGWLPFLDSLDGEPHFLALYLPVRRANWEAQVGFPQLDGTPEWRRPDHLAERLKRINIRAIALVTVAAPPGYDSFRGVIQFANELSEKLRQPVFFVCHQPGFEKFVDNLPDQRPETPWALMLDALSRGKDLHHSFWYARNQVNQRISEAIKPVYGIPGCFLPDDPGLAPQVPSIWGGPSGKSVHAQATAPREAKP